MIPAAWDGAVIGNEQILSEHICAWIIMYSIKLPLEVWSRANYTLWEDFIFQL